MNEEVELGAYCERVTVGHVGPMADQYRAGGIPFLRSQDIKPFSIKTEGVKFIDEEFDHKLRKSRLRHGDVVIVRTGYPGTAAVVPLELDGANCADLVILTPGPELDPWFVVSLLNSTWGRSTVAGNLVGVAQQHFNVGAAKSLRLRLPTLSVQSRIGDIVREYCNLIALNFRRIAILEEMARRLFEEWFVQLRFPGFGNANLVSTPIGPLPERWAVVSPHDLGDIQYGFPFKSKQFNIAGRGRPIVRIRDILPGESATFTEERAADRYILRDFDILIGMDGEFHMNVWSSGEAWLNQRVARVRARSGIPTELLYRLLYSPIKKLEGEIVGTTVAHLSARDMNEVRVPIPPNDLLKLCAKYFDDWLWERMVLDKSNRVLQAARDLLLPRLISGDIDLSRAEREVERVAAE